ncbi:hypothetical protein RF11_01113 [Thelohanellus kitauei]|uniref:Uncharacterized protein n=1 Tax=Thelohanellus kitauei TaxID=669202 RepID=A0A0C2N7G1_THEKT|nr:hypothetical protein RF11_01113 [Thelohanellus kitauei]
MATIIFFIHRETFIQDVLVTRSIIFDVSIALNSLNKFGCVKDFSEAAFYIRQLKAKINQEKDNLSMPCCINNIQITCSADTLLRLAKCAEKWICLINIRKATCTEL